MHHVLNYDCPQFERNRPHRLIVSVTLAVAKSFHFHSIFKNGGGGGGGEGGSSEPPEPPLDQSLHGMHRRCTFYFILLSGVVQASRLE